MCTSAKFAIQSTDDPAINLALLRDITRKTNGVFQHSHANEHRSLVLYGLVARGASIEEIQRLYLDMAARIFDADQGLVDHPTQVS